MCNEASMLFSRVYVVLDIETTGLYPDAGDEVVELAAEKLVNGEVVETFHALLQPSRSMPQDAIAIHGLTDEYLHEHGVSHDEVFPRFSSFIEEAVLVGHNIRRFDLPFLAAHFRALGLSAPENDIFDTLEHARAALNLPNYRLSTVATHLGISTAGAHRAAADVEITRKVLIKLLALFVSRPSGIPRSKLRG